MMAPDSANGSLLDFLIRMPKVEVDSRLRYLRRIAPLLMYGDGRQRPPYSPPPPFPPNGANLRGNLGAAGVRAAGMGGSQRHAGSLGGSPPPAPPLVGPPTARAADSDTDGSPLLDATQVLIEQLELLFLEPK